MTHELVSNNHEAEKQENGRLAEGTTDSESEEAIFIQSLCSVHSIVLDWTVVGFIDSVGAKAVKQVPLFGFSCVFS